MFTRKPRLQPAEFLITSAKRLLQHNRHIASFRCAAIFGRYWSNSGQSDPPTNKPRPTHCNAIDDRALPQHGSSKDGLLPSEGLRRCSAGMQKDTAFKVFSAFLQDRDRPRHKGATLTLAVVTARSAN